MSKSLLTFCVALTLFSAGMVRAEEEGEAADQGKAQVQGNLQIETSGPEGLILRIGEPAEGTEEQGEAAERIQLGPYWIGVAVQPLNEEQRKELKVEGEGGLIVEQVVPDGPAAKAGLKPHDVIVKVGDKPLAAVRDLIEAVNETKGEGLKLEVVREGKSLPVEVKAEKRSELPMSNLLPPAEAQRMQQWMEKIEKDMGEGKPGMPFRFHVFRPGAILPPDVLFQRGLPEDMTIVVTRTGKKPAKIVIEQGDKRYEATEDKLGELPKEVRPFAESMLGRLPMVGVRVIEPQKEGAEEAQQPQENNAPKQEVKKAPVERPMIRMENRLERRLEEMNQRIENLNKAVNEMREAGKHGESKPEPKPEVQEQDVE